ncbi:cellulase family glycosylhydrolase [Paenibacillus sp. LMG 31461]|uniref:Beta-galactosidase n=1 Tax=Paenibacillus plantarum TaxID=2654975 RepID=A0ABX1XKB6_9BACL|nr:beta-galactosidase [Paenibacillus plantarum]NOU68867.1 cellulase family glycosylhydrolase [Paenibacillus plantarum]
MDRLRYGVAYYDEYMPYDRLEQDIQMMKEAGINVVRIAESTWSTMEPQNGVFDFRSVDRVLTAMHKAGIQVIVGTPTYAVPTWMVKLHPDILAVTPQGPGKYGTRQNMDITHPAYLYYAERMIRKLIAHVKDHPAVIGFQTDNETKHYRTVGPNVQLQFLKYMRDRYVTLEAVNRIFGLDYWSNRINAWEDFPSMEGTINASLGAEFAKFTRKLVSDFLSWQVSIVNEFKRQDQFVTHNFDFDWRGHSYGMQPEVDHFDASIPFEIAGVDIYHPSQDELTGIEISFGGDIARSLKMNNYFVLETQAQAFPHWTPYPGQLRQQAFSHLASGANMVSYWHWHSIHNSAETYWKGLLSHDFQPNPVYMEAKSIGRDFARLSPKLTNLKKLNQVALLLSNESLTALEWFPLPGGQIKYNDIVRLIYDELYKLNIECDVLPPSVSQEKLAAYKLILVPALYCAPDELLHRLNAFVHAGGNVLYTFKSGFSDENVKVRTSQQPGIIQAACGIGYSMFVEPTNVKLKDDPFEVGEEGNRVEVWMELIQPTTAKVLAYYDHPHWGKYAAVTQNNYGFGKATYMGCLLKPAAVSRLLEILLQETSLLRDDMKQERFPIIVKSGVNTSGNRILYFFNYSSDYMTMTYMHTPGKELQSERTVETGEQLELDPWGVSIIEV